MVMGRNLHCLSVYSATVVLSIHDDSAFILRATRMDSIQSHPPPPPGPWAAPSPRWVVVNALEQAGSRSAWGPVHARYNPPSAPPLPLPFRRSRG